VLGDAYSVCLTLIALYKSLWNKSRSVF